MCVCVAPVCVWLTAPLFSFDQKSTTRCFRACAVCQRASPHLQCAGARPLLVCHAPARAPSSASPVRALPLDRNDPLFRAPAPPPPHTQLSYLHLVSDERFFCCRLRLIARVRLWRVCVRKWRALEPLFSLVVETRGAFFGSSRHKLCHVFQEEQVRALLI